ncbi:phage major capsid protein [Agrobacterium tumefaciens]|uniref:phage major capsid protein n=1 Tax=Agrobacterium tumefaciens TaxID=358 RepID=UPI001CBC1734|nr:phage major capsid protein [Agrobacterium tumefaciens]MDP9875649.1 HK97 family phage major capsid protein [Agrobacterium tumefaciens]MDP9980564.1 HK97 family phage major capsid protein [Agrobacterium tumefaciens]
MTVQLKELREKRAVIATNARAKFDEIKDDTPAERAAEIEREFDAMMADADKIDRRIAQLEKLVEIEDRGQRGDNRRPLGEDTNTRSGGSEDDEPTAEYKEVFAKVLRFGASSLTPEERSIVMEHRAALPTEARAQAAGDPGAGGYTVPEGFSGEIDLAMSAWGPMWDADIVRELNTTTGNKVPWPTVDDTAEEGEAKAENAPVTDDGSGDVSFGSKELDAYIYDTKMVRIPLELLQDSAFDIEALLNDLFGERLGRTSNRLLTVGTGVSQPHGIVTASSLGKAAASKDAIAPDELIDLVHSVDPAYRASPKCRWQFNDTTLGTIRKLKDGQGNYLWQMGDVRTGEPDKLLAHPYSVNQAMANIGASAKPIIFGDHSRYVVRKVRGFTVLTLRERYAENFQIGMIGFKRFDGELLNNKAVKHLANAAA